MTRRSIRVLVVDDAPLIRELIMDSLALHSEIQVVGTAGDGEQALRLITELQPDVVTLDLQMPKLDGLAALERMLADRPVPVIVVSSLTQRGADTTMQALQTGALDYVAKPEGLEALRRVFCEELPGKIRNMAGADVRRILQYRKARELRARTAADQQDPRTSAPYAGGCIALGISTGGPPALSNLFGALSPPLPPIVIVQHMPQLFTGPFANRLNSLSSLLVKEAAAGDVLKPNCAYVAPGGTHLSLSRRGRDAVVTLHNGEFVSGHKPSVDVMMTSAAQTFGHRCLGIIMTGMGRDGATGCGAIRAAGGYVLGQDEITSDVYGMNKVAFLEGHVDRQVGLENLPDAIMTEARLRCSTARAMQLA